MDKIEKAILDVLKKVNEHRKLYERNEEAVKQHLIGGIFQALGWEWDNPKEVRPEERTEEGRADYALITGDRVVAFIEAKNLSINVLKKEKPLRQLGRYCFNNGVKYGILTNGVAWVVIKAFEEGSRLEDRVILSVDIENEPIERTTLKLSLLSKSRIEKLERFATLLRALEFSFDELKREGISERKLIEFLTASKKRLLTLEKLRGDELPRALYLYDDGWKIVPLVERSIKGVLLSLLLYLSERSEGEEKAQIKKAYAYLKEMPIDTQKILRLLHEIEKEKGIRIGIEI
ncbi:type I restriction enzyme HsdR N-terminal domain-containing protein [Thermococcus sp. SY098]|uniref:type I restriction enzyme HsdR N-terminal domain-containing protein n=1 Tax=Thermococcus sp. SY098 TaxID=3111325 RepID=UPI002D793F8E|nr:type I restriction enzyme HsdR N-terminal domain-containing protein [Thermococcus sp. SY098]WRS52658.1 type I restriction enzyme HsdR N-terminal domain-containing protein [Thermococcus sp. SY098]